MSEYLKAVDDTMRRYHACHCPFAKESILSGTPVSSTLCNCSLGHVMNFIEAFLECSLQGKVIRSVLNGDLTCEYEIVIPNDIIAKYVTPWETDIVIQNYYQYYRAFTLSGIVELYEEAVDWIMPKEGETGPSLAFHIHLDENRLEGQIQELISGIHAKTIPQRWIITPDATPTNIVSSWRRRASIISLRKSLTQNLECFCGRGSFNRTSCLRTYLLYVERYKPEQNFQYG